MSGYQYVSPALLQGRCAPPSSPRQSRAAHDKRWDYAKTALAPDICPSRVHASLSSSISSAACSKHSVLIPLVQTRPSRALSLLRGKPSYTRTRPSHSSRIPLELNTPPNAPVHVPFFFGPVDRQQGGFQRPRTMHADSRLPRLLLLLACCLSLAQAFYIPGTAFLSFPRDGHPGPASPTPFGCLLIV